LELRPELMPRAFLFVARPSDAPDRLPRLAGAAIG
jgi:hypothetical protein